MIETKKKEKKQIKSGNNSKKEVKDAHSKTEKKHTAEKKQVKDIKHKSSLDMDSLFSDAKTKKQQKVDEETKKNREEMRKVRKELDARTQFKQQESIQFTRIDKETGLKVYTPESLGIGKGGNTPLCPFDCDCCF
ncbi:hypothetical protein WA158_005020 [Blastocystis sp. Blastoise]